MRLLPSLALLLSFGSALAGTPVAPPPPSASPAPVAVAGVAAPVDTDPYQWLEEVEGERALTWVKERNAVSEGELGGDAGYEPLRSRILSIMDSKEKIPSVYKMGRWYYNFWKDAEHVRGIWRRTSWSEYRKDDPKWETLIDVDALGAAENVSWVWSGANCLPPEYERCLVQLSRGGADADVVREFDLGTRAWVENGFTLPEAKLSVAWADRDTLWLSTDFGPGSMTTSGYAREVRRWRRGTPYTSAELVFTGKETDVSVSGYRELTEGFERDWLYRSETFWTGQAYLLRDGKQIKIEVPDDANLTTFREWMFVELRSDWTVGGRTWKQGSLIGTRLEDFLAGSRSFDLLFEPTERVSLASMVLTRHHVVLRLLDNVRSRVEVLTPGKKGWERSNLPGLPEMGNVGVSAVDPEHNDELFITVTDFVTPTTLSWVRIGKGTPTPLKQLPAFFDATGLEITQHETKSADGTRVPYFEVARRDVPLDGSNRTLLYGYGGFEVSMLPNYSGTIGAGWLERGGVYVLANIRGGGEFGPAWHSAALRENRRKAYEDFAAVAQDLVARKVTSKEHLGIMGGSNGGMLVGNMVTGWPDLFEAAVCQVPLLDMRRYSHLLAGASWIGEYGDPDVPEDWAFLQNYSPYHKVRADVDYPRTLFMTSTRDDRVHPGHARKMAARMLEQGHDILYFENVEGGHGGAADNKQAARMWAYAYTFLWKELE